MYYADNDFGYEPTSEDLQDWQDSDSIPESDPDPFVSHTLEGSFWEPIHVFTRKSSARVEMNSKDYAELVNSQK